MAQKSGGRKKTPASDATGKKAAQLQKEHADELAERAKEMALITEQEAQEREEGVTDVNVFPRGMSAANTRQATDPDVEVDESGYMTVEGRQAPVKTNATEVTGLGPETPFDVPGSTPEFERTRRVVDTDSPGVKEVVRRVESESEDEGRARVVGDGDQMVVFRVNETLEDVTIGQGNTFTFEEGRQYRVPRYVRDHLEEKGYIWH